MSPSRSTLDAEEGRRSIAARTLFGFGALSRHQRLPSWPEGAPSARDAQRPVGDIDAVGKYNRAGGGEGREHGKRDLLQYGVLAAFS